MASRDFSGSLVALYGRFAQAGMGFEPMAGVKPAPVFKTGSFGRSDTPPVRQVKASRTRGLRGSVSSIIR